ncbi:uncharacterized protein TrAtP1_011202 [Trichoderma atroviride]|uniref:uncharacterized protein n=1 Tax=Hypocrea atroviridis TaxID=63577 RepID=UPI0033343893|nr:hypothetical protein TrAtP1_011202 [Trichoderma atroviride]
MLILVLASTYRSPSQRAHRRCVGSTGETAEWIPRYLGRPSGISCPSPSICEQRISVAASVKWTGVATPVDELQTAFLPLDERNGMMR